MIRAKAETFVGNMATVLDFPVPDGFEGTDTSLPMLPSPEEQATPEVIDTSTETLGECAGRLATKLVYYDNLMAIRAVLHQSTRILPYRDMPDEDNTRTIIQRTPEIAALDYVMHRDAGRFLSITGRLMTQEFLQLGLKDDQTTSAELEQASREKRWQLSKFEEELEKHNETPIQILKELALFAGPVDNPEGSYEIMKQTERYLRRPDRSNLLYGNASVREVGKFTAEQIGWLLGDYVGKEFLGFDENETPVLLDEALFSQADLLWLQQLRDILTSPSPTTVLRGIPEPVGPYSIKVLDQVVRKEHLTA